MLQNITLLVIFLVSVGCSHITKKAESYANDLPVIDTHTHTSFDGKIVGISGVTDSLESYIDSMKKAGVVGAISHSPREEDQTYQDLSQYNVIQCYGVGFEINPSRVESVIKDGRFKCIKIYLGYVYRYPNDEQYRKLYRLAEKYKVPVVFHTGDTYSKKGKLKFSDPLGIDEVAVDFPNVTFVIAHMGNPWIQSAAEVAYKNPNVYIEGSALLIGKLTEEPQDKLDEYVVKPISWTFGYIEDPSKIMFGTDWPLADIKPYLELYKKAIPKKHWCDVFYNNAVKVFGFKDTHKCEVN